MQLTHLELESFTYTVICVGTINFGNVTHLLAVALPSDDPNKRSKLCDSLSMQKHSHLGTASSSYEQTWILLL